MPFDTKFLLVLIFSVPLLAGLILLSWVSRKLGRRPRGSWTENRWGAVSAAAVLLAYAACFLYGVYVEADDVELTRTEIRVGRPVLGKKAFRIVHLSDFHLEGVGRRERRVLELVREANPDIILMTGDYLNVPAAEGALLEMLRGLHAPLGVYGVNGNWDYLPETRRVFGRAGIVFLEDEARVIERGGSRLRLAGLSVLSGTSLGRLLQDPAEDDFVVYLHHTPDGVDEMRDLDPGQRVDLFLCGHTHGGQVCLPFWGAVITLSKYHKEFESGLREFRGVPVYVNRGVGLEGGVAPRVRFLCRPEVAVIDLVSP